MLITDKIFGLSFQCDPPVAVHDLFTDVQDGRILMALLEQLSGCKMVRVKLSVESGSSKKRKKTTLHRIYEYQ